MPRDRLIAVVVLVVCLLSGVRGGGDAPRPDPSDCPITADGLHWVILKQYGQKLTPEQQAALGSQNVEDAVEEAGGEYLAVWSDAEADKIPAEYRAAVEAMRNGSGLPQLCAACSDTGQYYLGPYPPTEAACLELLNQLGGAR